MSATLTRFTIIFAVAAIIAIFLGCSTSHTVVYHNPLKRGIERTLFLDTNVLNPNAASHPSKIDLRNWYTNDTLMGADTMRFLESYPHSDIDTMYHPSEYVGAAHPIYRLTGSEDGRIKKLFLSDDSTYVIEPTAYIVDGYQLEFMIPYRNEVGFKSGRVHLAWIDSLSRLRTIDRMPEAKQLAQYSLLGGLMMFLIIGSQNGLF